MVTERNILQERLPSGDELRVKRQAAGWSQQEVARRLGISQSLISRTETRDDLVSATVIRAYAALFEQSEASTAPLPRVCHALCDYPVSGRHTRRCRPS